ncbi:MAG: hypothetical protein FWH41_02150, partial [Treponema sp.]|nr:hypothetical protein [Treponema sp.]
MKKLLRSLFAALLFFAITMPFREFFRVMPVTEIRPVSALPPALGLIWGFPGALGCAIGNLIADFLSGYHPLMCILGFPVQLFYGLFPLLMWKFLNKAKAARNPFIRLNNVKNALRYIAIILIDSLITAALLGLLMKEFEIVPFYSSSTLILFLNNFVFCMALGVPIIIFSTIIRIKTHHIDITLNERLALILLLICVISAGITGVFSYLELSRSINDTLSLWNQIYLYIAIEQIIFHIMALTILSYLEKNITIPIESIARIAKNYINSDKEKTDSLSIASQCEKFTKIQNEAGALAQSFRKMVLDLDKYIINLTAVTG